MPPLFQLDDLSYWAKRLIWFVTWILAGVMFSITDGITDSHYQIVYHDFAGPVEQSQHPAENKGSEPRSVQTYIYPSIIYACFYSGSWGSLSGQKAGYSQPDRSPVCHKVTLIQQTATRWLSIYMVTLE